MRLKDDLDFKMPERLYELLAQRGGQLFLCTSPL